MKRFIQSLAIAALTAQTALAIPADPQPKQVRQPDGTMLTVVMRGDEHHHLLYTEDGYPLYFNRQSRAFEYASLSGSRVTGSGVVAVNRDDRQADAKSYLSSVNVSAIEQASLSTSALPRKAAKRGDFLISDYPTTGRQKTLVVLFQFSDVKFSSIDDPKQFYTDMLNKPGFTWSNGANGSAWDFYNQSSMGQFDPEFVVVGPVTLSNKATYYGSDDNGQDFRMGEALKEACDAIDGEVDFSEYDTNGDGYIDNVYFFYAGGGQADDPNGTDYIWPHSAIAEESWGVHLTYDGKSLGHYACSNELRYSAAGNLIPTGIGTFVHEFGHVLGLDDHYSTTYNLLAFGLGQYDTMAQGSYNNNMNTPPLFSAFERAELAWLDYDQLSTTTDTITCIPDLAVSNRAFRIDVPGKEHEFYVLENRQQNGFDQYLPGKGMLVWHIDQDSTAWANNTVNNDAAHQRVDIVEADGKQSDDSRNGDTFPGAAGVTQYTLSTWAGDALVSFDDVTLRNDTIRLLLANTDFRLPAPASIQASEVQDSSFVFTWDAVDDAKLYLVSAYTTDSEGNKTFVQGFDHKQFATADRVLIDGLLPETDYTLSVVAGLGGYRSEETTESVQTQVLAFVKRQPVGLSATNITSTGFTANWEAVPDAEGYLLSVYKHDYSSQPTTQSYDFTDKYDGLPALWNSTSNTYYSVKGYYGAASPSLRLSYNDDCLTVAYPETVVGSVSFWCRAKNSGEKLIVEADNGDGTWTELQTLEVPTTGKTLTVDANRSDRVRLRYQRTAGFVVIDDVTVSGYQMERQPVSGLSELPVGDVLSYAVSGLTPSATYSFSMRGVQGDEKTVSAVAVEVTLAGATGIEQTVVSGQTDGAVYDLSGRRMLKGTLPKGVYIRNGKKIVRSGPND